MASRLDNYSPHLFLYFLVPFSSRSVLDQHSLLETQRFDSSHVLAIILSTPLLSVSYCYARTRASRLLRCLFFNRPTFPRYAGKTTNDCLTGKQPLFSYFQLNPSIVLVPRLRNEGHRLPCTISAARPSRPPSSPPSSSSPGLFPKR